MNIVITGASSGIGHALAGRLGAAGYAVWGLSRTVPLDAAGRATACDVSDWRETQAAADEIGRVWTVVDALICCAGVQGVIGPAMTVDPAAWSHTVRINLDGTFHALTAFYPLLGKTARRAKALCFSGGGRPRRGRTFPPTEWRRSESCVWSRLFLRNGRANGSTSTPWPRGVAHAVDGRGAGARPREGGRGRIRRRAEDRRVRPGGLCQVVRAGGFLALRGVGRHYRAAAQRALGPMADAGRPARGTGRFGHLHAAAHRARGPGKRWA